MVVVLVVVLLVTFGTICGLSSRAAGHAGDPCWPVPSATAVLTTWLRLVKGWPCLGPNPNIGKPWGKPGTMGKQWKTSTFCGLWMLMGSQMFVRADWLVSGCGCREFVSRLNDVISRESELHLEQPQATLMRPSGRLWALVGRAFSKGPEVRCNIWQWLFPSRDASSIREMVDGTLCTTDPFESISDG